MSIYTIYKATNTINGKVYIGFDSNWPVRKRQHLRSAEKNSKFLFHCALREYGPDAFEWEAICQSKDGNHLLNEMEHHFIKEYNSFYLNGQGYNMTLGGDGFLGYKRTDEERRRISQSKTGIPRSEETKRRISESKRNLPLSEKQKSQLTLLHETLRKRTCSEEHLMRLKRMREKNTGSTRSEETKRKISQSKTGKKLTKEHKENISISQTGKKDLHTL